MGPRQLSLLFGISTAIVALFLAGGRMAFGLSNEVGIVATLVLYALSSAVFISIARKKWDLGYRNALIMLVSCSFFSSIVYAIGYEYVQNIFPEAQGEDDQFVVGGLFVVNLVPRIIFDAIAAIFHKRKAA